jgi:hypothetical protein
VCAICDLFKTGVNRWSRHTAAAKTANTLSTTPKQGNGAEKKSTLFNKSIFSSQEIAIPLL